MGGWQWIELDVVAIFGTSKSGWIWLMNKILQENVSDCVGTGSDLYENGAPLPM